MFYGRVFFAGYGTIEKIKDGRQNWPFCKYCDFIDAGLRMDAVDDVLHGRAMHGARQSLRRNKD